MDIVLFNHYAGSPDYGMEYRPYYLAKYWVRDGHTVTIVGSSFSHLRNNQPSMKNYKLYQEEFIDGIRYVWVRGNKYQGNGIGRFINILMYTSLSIFLGKIVKLCDLIITSSTYPLDIFAAIRLRNRFPNAKLIFEPHDLWPMVLYEIGEMSRKHPLVILMQLAEDLSCKHANAVVSMHPHNIDYLETRGCNRSQFYHIPNGVDIESFNNSCQGPTDVVERIQSLRTEGKKIVMYTGSVSIANGLDVLIDVADELRFLNLAFVIVGDGPDRREIEYLVQKMDINLYCFGRVKKDYIPSLLELSDICYVGFKHSPLYRYGMSANKLWDYMMAAKPILMSINSSNDPVEEAECGITVSSGIAADISHALKILLHKSDMELRKFGLNGQQYVKENNDYRLLANRFLAIVSEMD